MSSSSSSPSPAPVASSYKRAKLTSSTSTSSPVVPNSTKQIATHSGTFQADEALGVWLLRQTVTYRNSPVVRTRDPEVYSKADIVIDVGGVYDHEARRYDHHQRGYDERFPHSRSSSSSSSSNGEDEPRCTALSASGLVYLHYGREVITSHYPDLSPSDLELVYVKMYDKFLETVDAIDTGVEMVSGPPGSQLTYHDSTGLSIRVSRLNPRWNEMDNTTGSTPDVDERFETASRLCGEEFLNILIPLVESELPARAIVETAVRERHTIDQSGEIVLFPSGGLPWKRHLYNLEKELDLSDDDDNNDGGGGGDDDTAKQPPSPLVKFVLYTDQAGMWRVQAVTVEGQAFENRLSLPQEWRGVRDEDLTKIAGIEGCTFCHAAGFIGGNVTREGALEMARVALSSRK